MSGEYRGYEIRWVDFSRNFEIREDKVSVKDKVSTLSECQSWIDTRFKEKFNRVNVFHYGWYGKIEWGAATSLIAEAGDTYYIWFTNSKKGRSKENIKDIYIDNEINRGCLSAINSKQTLIKALEEEITALVVQMEHLTPNMMIMK